MRQQTLPVVVGGLLDPSPSQKPVRSSSHVVVVPETNASTSTSPLHYQSHLKSFSRNPINTIHSDEDMESLQITNERLRMDVLTLQRKLNGFDILRQENEELRIENGALASAMLTNETAVLQRLVIGKALVAPAKTHDVPVPVFDLSDSQQSLYHRSDNSSSSVGIDDDNDDHFTAQHQQHHQQQQQQRERKISAATRVLLELEELVKAAAEKAKPQVELEAEFAKERRKHANVIEELQKTIHHLNENATQQQIERDAVLNQLQCTLHGACERLEEKETLLRKSSLDMATLRADCTRLSESADRWQGKYEDLLLSTDRTCQDMVRLHGGTLAVVDATHQASLASEISKCSALEDMLSREVAAKTVLLDQAETDRCVLQEEILDKTRDINKLTRFLDQRIEEIEALQGRIRMLEETIEQENDVRRSARREWDNQMVLEKRERTTIQRQHEANCALIRCELDQERVTWQTEHIAIIADMKSNEEKLVAHMLAEHTVAMVLLESTNVTLQRRCHEIDDKYQRTLIDFDRTSTTANTTIAALTQDLLTSSLHLEETNTNHAIAMSAIENHRKQLQTERDRLDEVLHATALRVVGQEKETESLTAKLLATEALLKEEREAWASERNKVNLQLLCMCTISTLTPSDTTIYDKPQCGWPWLVSLQKTSDNSRTVK